MKRRTKAASNPPFLIIWRRLAAMIKRRFQKQKQRRYLEQMSDHERRDVGLPPRQVNAAEKARNFAYRHHWPL